MAEAETKKKAEVSPVDFGDLLERLRLGIGQAARVCGVSIRQLSYWTEKEIIKPTDDSRARTYDYPAIEKVCLIKQLLDQGFSLEGAVREAEAYLRQRQEERRRLDLLSEDQLEETVLAQAEKLRELADRIRRGLRTYRVSGDLGRLAASLTGLEKLIGFFEANPYTVNTARQIALRVGRETSEVEKELELLEQRKFLQKINYPGAAVFRHIPQRRR